jgi:hypothetical protein
MKKIIVLATAAFLFTGVAFANYNCDKCQKTGGKECKKDCKDCKDHKKEAKTTTAKATTTKAKA